MSGGGSDEVCMKVGDRRPILRVKLALQGDPGTNPLTGAAGVTFRLLNATTGVQKFSAAATIESVPDRIVSYSWGAGDTDTKGRFRGFFVVDYGGGVVQSFPACDGIPIRFE